VTITPFTEDGSSVDVPALERHLDRVVTDGLGTIVVNGGTGEFHALSAEEARLIVRTAASVIAERALLVAAVGHSIADAIDAARDAEDAGADAIMIHNPSHPHITEAGYLAYVRAIHDATELSTIAYIRSVELSDDGFRRLADLPRLSAIKYARTDLPNLGRVMTAVRGHSEVVWLCGIAELWAPAFTMVGAEGFTSGIVNVDVSRSLDLWRHLEAGDVAGTLATIDRIRPLEGLRSRDRDGANVAVLKAALRLLGRDAGPVRAPSSDADPNLVADVKGALERFVPTPAA
jgi:4-hydroxy-tetrahydrodipicolinate synthase